MKNKINFVTNIILVVCIIVITVVIVKKIYFDSSSGPIKISGWEQLLNETRTAGNSDGRIKILFFSNYQCAYCKKANSILNELLNERDDIQIFYYEFPSEKNEVSFLTAKISICGDKINKYKTVKDYLYQEQDLLDDLNLDSILKLAEVEKQDLFRKCISDPHTEDILFDDILTGKRLKIKYTPTLLVNGYILEGLFPKEEIVKLIDEFSNEFN